MKNQLTPFENDNLSECERIIEKTKHSFVECGMALAKINKDKLYRGAHKTFEEYCQKKWGWKRQYAYHLIEAAQIKKSPIGDKIENMGQAKALASVPEDQREEVLEKASKSGRVTAASITKAASSSKSRDIELDKTGFPIPKDILDEWQRAEEFSSVLRQISSIKCTVEAALDNKDIIFAEISNPTIGVLKNAYADLQQVIPYAVCTEKDHGKKCLCGGRGFISYFRWKNCVPQETKDLRAKETGKK